MHGMEGVQGVTGAEDGGRAARRAAAQTLGHARLRALAYSVRPCAALQQPAGRGQCPVQLCAPVGCKLLVQGFGFGSALCICARGAAWGFGGLSRVRVS